jgi:hypothetical protein
MAQTKLLVFGALLLIFGLLGMWITLFKFQWLRRRLPFLCMWGRGPFVWEASKEAVVLGFFMGGVFGLVLLAEYSASSMTQAFVAAFMTLLVITIPLAIRDYIRHRRNRRKTTPKE